MEKELWCRSVCTTGLQGVCFWPQKPPWLWLEGLVLVHDAAGMLALWLVGMMCEQGPVA